MKIINHDLEIQGKHFVLFNQTNNGKTFYGTIPFSDIDENGCIKSKLNGFQMCVENSASEAIECRERLELTLAWKEAHPNATEREQLEYIFSLVVGGKHEIYGN